MPLSQAARRQVAYAVRSMAVGKEICDGVDANTATLSQNARRALSFGVVNIAVGKGIADAVNASSALTAPQKNGLAAMMADRPTSNEIATAMAL